MNDDRIAALLALLAALQFGFGTQLTRLGLQAVDSRSGTLITIGASTAIYWLAAPWLLEPHYWTSSVVWLYVLIGLIRPALSSNLAMAGTARLGPTISSTLASVAPFFGLLFGVLLLGEQVGLPLLFGTVAIVGGVIALARRNSRRQPLVGEIDWPLWALCLPVLAALIRTIAQLVTKIGLEILPSPYFVGLVCYSTSFVVALGMASVNRSANVRRALRTPSSLWFVLTGVFYGGAVFTLNAALQFGPLSVVAPVVAAEPLFVLLFGSTILRESNLNRRVVTAVLLIVLGVMVISARPSG
ncbi:MAG: DMT family transporter [Gammaproteobacteria bacterium]|nr:DMT family transporter [Gammaproteobacteria bacterium]